MVPKFKTRDTAKVLYTNYLKRSEECYHGAKNSFEAREWNAATISAVHACIAASDAMCIYFLGKRSASESHHEATALFKTIKPDDEKISVNANRLSKILSIKNLAEYEDRLLLRREAEKALKDCERFLEFVKTKLPK